MPESEPKPKLIELVAPGAGQGWKAVLRNGKSVVIHEISAPAAEAAAALPRIQRLGESRHPALSPVLAWGTDPNGLWVAVEPNEGTPLGAILSRGPLTPPAAAALGAALLSGVSALHESGIAMGGFNAAAVRVTGNGEVRLSGHPAAAVRGAPSQSDLRADVRSCGMAICAAFGVDPAGAPAPPNIPPGLVVTMRSMASGAMGPAADRAQGALREMASALLAPDRATAAQAELATRAGGRQMPSITPFLPKEEEGTPQARPAAPPGAPWGAPAPQVTSTWAAQTTPRRDETPPPTPASYEPPPRGAETYPPAPAPYQPPAPSPASPPAPPAAPGPAWDEPAASAPAAPAPPAPLPPAPTPTREAFPWEVQLPPEPAEPAPAPAPYEPPPVSAPPPPPPAPKEPLSWDVETPAAPAPAPTPAPYEPPAPPKVEPSPPAPAADKPTWTAIPTPSWTPIPEVAKQPEPVAPAATFTAPPAAPRTPATGPISVPAPAPERKPPAPRRPVRDEPSGRPPWLIPAVAVIALLLLIGGGTGIFLASRGTNPGGGNPSVTPSSKPSAKASPTASPSSGPQAVPTYAPAAAAPITSVKFCKKGSCVDTAADTTCTLGGSCRVTVEIKFSSVQRTDIAYILKFFDRCTGTTTDLPGNHFTPPGFTTVDITAVVALPSGSKSAALVAVTTTPAAAESAPLMLGADTC